MTDNIEAKAAAIRALRESLADQINKARVTNQYAHGHQCPKCHTQYVCTDSVPVWDQEDTDCRWHVYLTCPKCRKAHTA